MKRDLGIDIMKFLAVLLITNSHMDIFYPSSLSILGTGGAIGDAFFFFCSGFTLFLKPVGRFDTFYKKRINRIYPSIFALAAIRCLVLGTNIRVEELFFHTAGGWFLDCIMIYYIVLWLIAKTMIKKLSLAFILTSIIIVVSYILWNKPDDFRIYGDNYFKWIAFFIVMLSGAIAGKSQHKECSAVKSGVILITSTIAFYAILMFTTRIPAIFNLQILSIIPLILITYYTYRLCNSSFAIKFLNSKVLNWIVMFVGGLCLEVLITQGILIRLNIGLKFPLNYIATFLLIIIFAYITRCVSRLFVQTFREKEYNWKEIFKAV